MKRLALLALFLSLAAHAQAPSPAQIGVSATTPQSLFWLDSTKTWQKLNQFKGTGGFTNTEYSYFTTSLLNGIDPGSIYHANWGLNYATDAFTAGVTVPATSTAMQVNAISAYLTTNAPAPVIGGATGGHVAGFFAAFAGVAGASIMGVNPYTGDGGFDNVSMSDEFDFRTSGHNPSINGISVKLIAHFPPLNAAAFLVASQAEYPWIYGSVYLTGVTSQAAIRIDPFGNQASTPAAGQPIWLGYWNGSATAFAKITADVSGNLALSPAISSKNVVVNSGGLSVAGTSSFGQAFFSKTAAITTGTLIGGLAHRWQFIGSDTATSGFDLIDYAQTANIGFMSLGMSRGTGPGNFAAVQANDNFRIDVWGDDGTNLSSRIAQLVFSAVAPISPGVIPGKFAINLANSSGVTSPVLSMTATGASLLVMPTASTGGSPLYVCIDGNGVLYKKATCP